MTASTFEVSSDGTLIEDKLLHFYSNDNSSFFIFHMEITLVLTL